jgi:hypothetical protein
VALLAGTAAGSAQTSPQGEPAQKEMTPPARQSPTGQPRQPAQTEPGLQRQKQFQPAQQEPAPGQKQRPIQTQKPPEPGQPGRAQTPRQKGFGTETERTQRQPEPGAPSRAQTPREPGQPRATQREAPSTTTAVQLNDQQRTRIRQVITTQNVQKTARVNFDIRVGVRVPRAEVRLFPVPVAIVSIVPAYRGYLYFYLEDEDVIVIVHPATLEIVAVIPA